MKRKNNFERVKQYRYTDDVLDENGEVKLIGNFDWWINEDEHEHFKEHFLEDCDTDEITYLGEREISGKEYNDWLIGNDYGDLEGTYVDEDCPECGSFLVEPNGIFYKTDMSGTRFCSECNYENDKHIEAQELEKKIREEEMNKPEKPKFREQGQTFDEFCEKYKVEEGSETTHCVVCKNDVPYNDFYICDGNAFVTYEHDNCTNKGPAKIIPFSQKQRDKWAKILG